MSKLPTGLVSHSKKVCNLYKRALRSLEDHYDHREGFRVVAVMLRAEFDENKCIKDMRVAKHLLEEGEKRLFKNSHWQPKQFTSSPGGVAYGREIVLPDWILDYWDPMEKAMYPEYFARREKRKEEYLKWWNKKYGPASKEDLGHH